MKKYHTVKQQLLLCILLMQISSQSIHSAATAANFDTLQTTLTGLTRPGSVSKNSLLGSQYSYVQHHVLPTVTRLASVCSFVQSTATDASLKGLIHMKGENVGTITSYDQGVIVAIQNNTGDQLLVNQISSAATNKIGSLGATGTEHYFLHTASLMPASTSAGSQDPVPSNMIEISDVTAGATAYVQVVSGSQLQSFVASFNQALNNAYSTTGYAFAYNEQSSASASYAPAGQYLLITNFNTLSSSLSSVNADELLMYRMQCVDISQFLAKPYFVTLQINKENVGYGISESELNLGSSAKSMLYPSIVSIKTLIMQNKYDKAYTKLYPAIQSYCAIPPLMIPKDVFITTSSSGVPGLEEGYHHWFNLYVITLMDSLLIPGWNDSLGLLGSSAIGLFDVSQQQAPARVVIDASGNLVSGGVLSLVQKNDSAEYDAMIGTNENKLNLLTYVQSNTSALQGIDKYQDMPVFDGVPERSNNRIVINSVANVTKALNYLQQLRQQNPHEGMGFAGSWGMSNAWDSFGSSPYDDQINLLQGLQTMLNSSNYSVDEQNKILAMSNEEITNKINELSSQVNTLRAQYSSIGFNTYMLLMGSDVIDIGSDYHQDIPILNLYKNQTSGAVVANQQGGEWINFKVTFGFCDISHEGDLTTFAQGYGVPYNNVMMFSLPAAYMKTGVIGELSQMSPGNYELIFKQLLSEQQLQALQQQKAQELIKNNSQLTQAAALQQAQVLDYGVLVVQKVFLDSSIKNQTQMNIQFLNSNDAGWQSSTVIPASVASVAVGAMKPQSFTLTLGTKNMLTAVPYTAPVSTVGVKKLSVKSAATSPVTTGSVATSPVKTKTSAVTSPVTTKVSPVISPAKKTGLVAASPATSLVTTKTSSVTLPATTGSVVTTPVEAKSKKTAPVKNITQTGSSVVTSKVSQVDLNMFKVHMASLNKAVSNAVTDDPKNTQLKNIQKNAQALQKEFEHITSLL